MAHIPSGIEHVSSQLALVYIGLRQTDCIIGSWASFSITGWSSALGWRKWHQIVSPEENVNGGMESEHVFVQETSRQELWGGVCISWHLLL